jgi:Ca-activated chloride channel family protein
MPSVRTLLRRLLPGLLGALALAVSRPPDARASGFLVPTAGARPPQAEWALESQDVEVVGQGPHLLVTVEQTFRNLTDRTLETEYLFPLPREAVVTSLTLFEGGQGLEGRLLRAADARRAFEEIVRRRRDPALLRYLGHNLYSVRVFPLGPRESRRLVLKYEQAAARDGGVNECALPLGAGRLGAGEGARVRVRADLEEASGLGPVHSPTHDVRVERLGPTRARVAFEGVARREEPDLVLYWSASSAPVGATVLTWWPRDEDRGWFLFLAAPTLREDGIRPKSLTLAVDTSGSMAGEKIEQVRAALQQVIGGLNPGDRLNLISYHSSVVPLYSEPRLVDAQVRAEALAFVTRLRAGGGTHIEGALTAALSAPVREDMPSVVLFLTDGRPTMGETDPDRILALAREADPEGRSRLFVMGVGVDVHAVLLDRLALEHHGAPAYVRPRENVESKVAALYEKIRHPVLSDVRFEAHGAQVSEPLPAALPDLFRGSEASVAGRYARGGRVEFVLSGRDGSVERAFHYAQFLPERGEGLSLDFPARVWATRRIATLLDAVRLLGREEPELVEEIVRLSTRFGILTEYTAFLADERDVSHAHVVANVGRARENLEGLAPRRLGGVGVAQAVNQAARRLADRAPGAGQTLVLPTPDDRDLEAVDVVGVRQVANRTFWYRGPETGWVDGALAEPEQVDETVLRWSPRFFEILATTTPDENVRLAQSGPLVVQVGARTLRVLDP